MCLQIHIYKSYLFPIYHVFFHKYFLVRFFKNVFVTTDAWPCRTVFWYPSHFQSQKLFLQIPLWFVCFVNLKRSAVVSLSGALQRYNIEQQRGTSHIWPLRWHWAQTTTREARRSTYQRLRLSLSSSLVHQRSNGAAVRRRRKAFARRQNDSIFKKAETLCSLHHRGRTFSFQHSF